MGHREPFGSDLANLNTFRTAYVNSPTIFDSVLSGDTVNVTSDLAYIWSKPVNTTTYKFMTTGINVAFATTNNTSNTWTTEIAPGETLLSGATGRIDLSLNIDSANGGDFVDLSAGVGIIPLLFTTRMRVQGFDSLGNMDGMSFVSENVGYLLNGAGFTFNDMDGVSMAEQNFVTQTGDHLTFTGSLGTSFFTNNIAAPASGDAVFNISSTLTGSGPIQIFGGVTDTSAGGVMFEASGKDQTDPRINVQHVFGVANSCWTAAMGFMNNVTETELTLDTWTDIAGVYVVDDEHLERANHDTAGVLESESLESYRAKVSVEMSVTNAQSAANRVMRVGIFVDTGSGFVEKHSACFSINGNLIPFSFSKILKDRLELGHRVKVHMKNTTNNDNATVIDINVKTERQD
ncbi:MAG: hypothetical protein V3U75_13545 [Methylococcaceae bacterium]